MALAIQTLRHEGQRVVGDEAVPGGAV